MAKKGSKLTVKERAFVELYLGKCRGNATEAALQAGYGSNRKSASVLSARLLGNVRVQRLIAEHQLASKSRAIADAAERDEILSRIARNKFEDALTRISAVKELNKCTGRHSIKHLHEGRLTLEEAIAQSRQ